MFLKKLEVSFIIINKNVVECLLLLIVGIYLRQVFNHAYTLNLKKWLQKKTGLYCFAVLHFALSEWAIHTVNSSILSNPPLGCCR